MDEPRLAHPAHPAHPAHHLTPQIRNARFGAS